MSDSNKSALTKADVILMKMDKLNQQMNAIEAALAAPGTDNLAALSKKIDEQGNTFKQEMHFLSAQLESLFSTMESMMQKLSDKIDAIKIPENAESIDTDKLAQDIASKIVLPENVEIDSEKLA